MWAILVVRAVRFAVLVHPAASLSSVCCLWWGLGLNFDVWENKALHLRPPSPVSPVSVHSFLGRERLHLCRSSVNASEHEVWLSLWICWADEVPRYAGISATSFHCNTASGMVRVHVLQDWAFPHSPSREHTEMKGRGAGGVEVKEEWTPILHVVSFKLESNL